MIEEIINGIIFYLLLMGSFSLVFSSFSKSWFDLISGVIYITISIIYIVAGAKSKN